MDSRDTASAAFGAAGPAGEPADRDDLARPGRLASDGHAEIGWLGGRRGAPVAPPTIYDVASAAGVSIASVSRVLNGRGNPMPETRERVLQAVAELGFIPDGAARALSARLKEIIGVVIRRPPPTEPLGDDIFQDEEESLQFPDLINRGIELAAQNRDYNLLVSSVDVDDHDHTRRVFALARKSDGLILHDQVLDAEQLERLSRQVPVVTLAGVPTPTTSNVGGDNQGSMREMARHLVRVHGYRTLAYLGGHRDSPDNLARQAAFSAEVEAAGGTFSGGPEWQGNYCAAGGARVIDRILAKRQRRRPASAGHRLRQRPDRAGRRVRAHAARAGRARGRRGDRFRRHPGGPPPPAPADHRAPAHPGTRRDRFRGALFHDQRRRARPAQHRPAHPADPP